MDILWKLPALYLDGWPHKESMTMNADTESVHHSEQHSIMRSEIHGVEELSRNK